MPKDTILSYANDTVIIAAEESWHEAQYKMNTYLENVANWLALNKLSLNANKTISIYDF